MPIKFKCPGCQKGLTVKEEMAGKRGKCPNPECQKIFVVPAMGKPAAANPAAAKAPPVNAAPPKALAAAPGVSGKPPAPSPPPAVEAPPPVENAEDLASELFTDKPEEKVVEYLEFKCPQCDEPLKLPVELGGKQAPCPECRRIIKVPLPAKKDPNNWRQTDALPAGARRDTAPAPEGAWVPSKATLVSGEALEEAGALPDQAEPLTKKQLAVRVVLGLSAVSVVVFGVLLIWDMMAGSRKTKLMKQALQYTSNEPGKPALGDEGAAAIHQAAGEFHLRRNERDSVKPPKGDEGAWNQFGKARARLATARQNPTATVSNDSEAQLIELALAQLELGGDGAAVEKGTRLAWKDVTREVGTTLTLIRTAEARREALRWIVRQLLAKQQVKWVPTLCAEVSPMPGLTPPTTQPGRPAPGRLSSDAPDAVAVVGLELLKAGQQAEATALLQQLQAVYVADPKYAAQVPPLTVDVVAFYTAMGQKPPAPANEAATVQAGNAVAPAWQGKADEARQQSGAIRTPLSRFDALAAIAASGDKEAAEAAAALANGELVNQALSPWALLAVVQAGLRNEASDETMLGLANRIRDPGLKGRAQLAVLRNRLAKNKNRADDGALEIVDAKTLSAALARLELMRHNSKIDSGSYKAIDDWADEAMKPYGYAGAALGLQDE